MILSKGKRECELKYEIKNDLDEKNIIKKIKMLGFEYKSNNLESDYTPDVEGFLCRKQGIMLRFRVIEGTENEVLLTLKIKGDGKEFQDNYEIETLFSKFDKEKFKKINEILIQATQNKLPEDIIKLKKINEIVRYLKENQFSQHRMFSQKKRIEYVDKKERKITIDEFPNKIGKYLEIECENSEDLFEMVDILKLNKENLEKRNYGEIIKEKQKDLPEEKRRTCVF